MAEKLQKVLAILAKLDMNTQEDILDEAICFFMDKGIDINADITDAN